MAPCHNKTDEGYIINADHLKHSEQSLPAVYAADQLGDAYCPGQNTRVQTVSEISSANFTNLVTDAFKML